MYNYHLISDLKDEINSLCDDLRILAAFVKDASEQQNKYSMVKTLVKQIRVAVYEAEDVVDTFVVHAAVQKARTHLEKAFHIIDYPAQLRSVARNLVSIRKKVKRLYDNKLFGFEVLRVGESSSCSTSSNTKKPIIVVEENIVGFEAEARMLVDQLIAPADELQVISMVGMGGLGKTTLAKKIFDDPSIQYVFFKHAWVHVSQVYTRREVFLSLLNNISQVTAEMSSMSEDKLAEELRRELREGRYLIVLDDVWTVEAWDDLKEAFPDVNKQSRIILTSRNREVALHATPSGSIEPLQLRFLTEEESLELLLKKVFGKGSRPSELEVIGKQIATKCCGLPLAIVVIAGVLRKNEKMVSYWEKVAESVSSYVAMNPEKCMDVLALSYNHLPHDLRACFLYFGVFPEDFEIPVKKLIHIWVAEGFIQRVGDVCLEDIAEQNLMDLIDRNLILVEKRRSNQDVPYSRHVA